MGFICLFPFHETNALGVFQGVMVVLFLIARWCGGERGKG